MTEPKPVHDKSEPVVAPGKTKSKGEKFFDRFVYGGIAGVGTFVATLGIAYKLKHGSWAGGGYARVVNGVESLLGKALSPKMSKTVAEESVMTTSLMMGGNAMVIPVGVAEHYKVPIVSGLNTMMGDTTPPATIEQAPKQTWRSLIEARLLAWGVVFSALFSASLALPKSFKIFQSEFGERTHQLVQWLKGSAKLPNMEKTRSYRIGELAALDVFATAAAATLLYVGGHFFARKQEEKKEQRDSLRHVDNASVATGVTEMPLGVPAAIVKGMRAHEGMLQAGELSAGKGMR